MLSLWGLQWMVCPKSTQHLATGNSLVAPFITYLEYLNGTNSNKRDILYNQFDEESETPEAACYLLSQDHLANQTVMVVWDHEEMPVLLGGLTQTNATSWGAEGSSEFDKVFLMSYGDDSVDVDVVYQDPPDYGAFEQYASLLQLPASGTGSHMLGLLSIIFMVFFM